MGAGRTSGGAKKGVEKVVMSPRQLLVARPIDQWSASIKSAWPSGYITRGPLGADHLFVAPASRR